MKIRKLDSKVDLVIDDIKKFSIIRVSPLLPVPFGDDDLDREAYDLSNSDISLTRGQLVFLVYTRNSIDLKLVFSELYKAGFQVRDISPNDPDESWPPRITSEKLLSYSSQELWRCIPCVGCMKLKVIEEDFLKRLLQSTGRSNLRTSFDKLVKPEAGRKLIDNLQHVYNADFSVIVYNFLDILSHARTETEIIRELTDSEASFRSLTASWFEHSELFQLCVCVYIILACVYVCVYISMCVYMCVHNSVCVCICYVFQGDACLVMSDSL